MFNKQSGKPGRRLWLIMAVLFSAAFNDFGAQTTIVRTKFGMIRGLWSRSTRGRLTAHYLGIPYAEPPIGDLRFRSPKPWSRKWNNTYDATKDGNMCIQPSREQGDRIQKNVVGSEDCLYLNIFVPILSEKRRVKTKLPVVVFVHGGRYMYGSNNSTENSPEHLMDQDIVLVMLNYRLSIMGFFTMENRVAPGNYGLKDIVMALRWLQENIEVFHGDPKSVTLAGQSAGAVAAHALSLNKKTEGLFHKIIIMSGTVYAPWNQLPRYKMRERSLRIAKLLGCLPFSADNSTDAIQIEEDPGLIQTEESLKLEEQVVGCMRSLDGKTVISILKDLIVWFELPCCLFAHVLEEKSEDAVVTEHPLTVIKNKQFRDIPIVVGVTKDEGLIETIFFRMVKDLTQQLMENWDERIVLTMEYDGLPTDSHKFASVLSDYYFKTNDTKIFIKNITDAISDSLVFHPTFALLKRQPALMKSSVFFYYFAYRGTFSNTFMSGDPIHYGVSHGDDLNYVIPYLNQKYNNFGLHDTESDVTIANIMTEYWASFATTGVPKAWGVTPWPDYRVAKKHLVIGNGTSTDITVGSNFFPERMAFWDELNKNYTVIVEDMEENEATEEPSISSTNYSDLLILLFTTIIAFV